MEEREGRQLLRELAAHLRKQRLPQPVGTPIKWAAKATDAIDGFLAGKVKSLDEAFGQKRGRGRPQDPERRAEIACQAIAMRSQGKTFDEIAVALQAHGIFLEESVIRGYVDEHRPKNPDGVFIAAHAEDVVRDSRREK